MQFFNAAVLVMGSFPVALASLGPFRITNTSEFEPVQCYAGPSLMYTITKTYELREEVNVTCQTAGQTRFLYDADDKRIENTNLKLWSKTTDDCFVSAYNIDATIDGQMVLLDECTEFPEPPNYGGGPMMDDYPWKNRCSHKRPDAFGYLPCTCVSFIAWRINDRLNVSFYNRYGNRNWKYADMWNFSARLVGWEISNVPKPGAIAHTDHGDREKNHSYPPKCPHQTFDDKGAHGRVAWVAAVNGRHITVEEYDYTENHFTNDRSYSWRTVDVSEFERFLYPKP